MAAGIVPALVGLAALIFIILPMLPDKGFSDMKDAEETSARTDLPSFMASITGPLVAVLLMVLRPLFGIAIDPAIALPVGGLAGVIATRKWKSTGESMSYGLEKMSSIAVLLVGTGTSAGVIKGSAVKDLGGGYRPGPPSARRVLPRHRRFHRDGAQGKAQADSLRIAYRTGAGEYDGRHDADNKLINNYNKEMVQTKNYKSPEISIIEIAGDQEFAVVAGSNFQSDIKELEIIEEEW